jgi:hypothetical protein
VNQIEPLFHSLDSGFEAVESFVGNRDVGVQDREITPHSGHVVLQGTSTLAEILSGPHEFGEIRSDPSQMLEDQVFDVLRHESLRGYSVSVSGFFGGILLQTEITTLYWQLYT